MAITKLADIYNPLIIAPLISERFLLKSALIRSGVVANDNQVAGLCRAGTIGELPFRADFSAHTDNVSSDDETTDAAAQKLTYSLARVAPLNRNGRWGAADLARVVAGDDPLAHIANMIGDFWAARKQDAMLSMLTGVFADNIANDTSDMLLDLSISTGTVAAANRISRDAIIEAKATAGDRRTEFAICFMNSAVAKTLEKLDATSFEQASQLMPFKTYNGMIVVEDDSIAITGTGAYKASTCYFATTGVFGYGESTEGLVAEELDRAPAGGNGGGIEYLYSRRRFALAPNGLSYIGAANPTNATLALAASWDRKVARKNVGLAAVKVNIL